MMEKFHSESEMMVESYCRFKKNPFGLALARMMMVVMLGLIIAGWSATVLAGPVEKKGEKTVDGATGKVIVTVSDDEISAAQSLTLKVEVVVPPGYTARMPAFEEYGFSTGLNERSQRFRVTHMTDVETTQAADGSTVLRQEFTLEPWLSGDYSIMPLMVSFFKIDQNSGKTAASDDPDLKIPSFNVMTDGFRIQVTPLEEHKHTLADLFAQSDWHMEKLVKRERRQEDMTPEELKREQERAKEEAMAMKKRRFPWWIVWTLLTVLAMGSLIWLVGRKKIRDLLMSPPQPAHEVAYLALKHLEQEQLVEKGQIKEFYYRLSYILREYIGNRFGIRAVNQTTEEFFHHLLASNPFDPVTESILRDFSDHADTVKYSLHRPDAQKAFESFRIVRSFVDHTKQPEPDSDNATPTGNKDQNLQTTEHRNP